MGGTSSAFAKEAIETAAVVLPAPDLTATLAFFRDQLDFRLDMIFPADAPAVALLTGHGLTVKLDRDAAGDSGMLALQVGDLPDGPQQLMAPNGTRIALVAAEQSLDIPPLQQKFTVQKAGDDGAWGVGRAGMHYRDLIPDREGGRFIASHIRIPQGGPVPDNVHFHKIRFQMIFCAKGWVRLVYEDQGEPFVMKAGDCVLQPPEIRHRVLESSDGLEVVEIGCPAEHLTCLDHDMHLPTGKTLPDRDFGGQRFVFHQADKARWSPWRLPGFEARDIGIGAATNGLAGARVARPAAAAGDPKPWVHDGEFLFLFILSGNVQLVADGHETNALSEGDCATIPAGLVHHLDGASADLELLEVSLPAAIG